MSERFHLILVINLRKSSTYRHHHGFLKFLALPLQDVHDSTPLLCLSPRKLVNPKEIISLLLHIKDHVQPQTAHHYLWLVAFHFRMAWTKTTPREWEGEETPGGGTPFTRWASKERAGGNKVGGGREVNWILANLAAHADGHRGGDIRRKAHSRREAP